jgi:uncharacterized protein (DUF1015 family)
MPAMSAPPPVADQSATGRGLVVAPFRGVRFDAAKVPDLATVTSPPYDVIDADGAVALERLDPHNVVRLILPREQSDDPRGRYEHAASRLSTWQKEGFLRRDGSPAIYVYEQSAPGMLQRGLLAAVELRSPDERVVLPHEDVMAGPVADRLELMRATGANLEPILLVYEGGGPAAEVIEEVATTEPLIDSVMDDGLRQRLWAVTDPARQVVLAADLAGRQALIADGHHRYATYRRLQAEHDGPGPWDRGLALLVDSLTYPLDVQAIHRSVADLPLREATELAAPVFAVTGLPGADLAAGLRALEESPARHPFLLTDGASFALLGDPDEAAVAAALPPLHSATWRSLDASVLHALLLERLWGITDGSARVSYLHSAAGAVRAASRSGGTAVLLRPVTVEQVLEVASTGERMPRKSTSFGPKPRTGLVLRLLDDEDGPDVPA